jgi:hypothetical protein
LKHYASVLITAITNSGESSSQDGHQVGVAEENKRQVAHLFLNSSEPTNSLQKSSNTWLDKTIGYLVEYCGALTPSKNCLITGMEQGEVAKKQYRL